MAEAETSNKTRAKRLQQRFPTVDDLRARARWRVPRFAFDFVDGGANEETCAARNRAAFRAVELMPRYCIEAKGTAIVVRALGKLGDSRLVDAFLPLVSRPEREVRIEAIQALARVADQTRADQVRSELQAQISSPDQTISRMAAAAVNEL